MLVTASLCRVTRCLSVDWPHLHFALLSSTTVKTMTPTEKTKKHPSSDSILACIHKRVLLVKENTTAKTYFNSEPEVDKVYLHPFSVFKSFILMEFMATNSFFGTHCVENPALEIPFNVSDSHSKPKSPQRECLRGHITQSECTLKRLLHISCVNTMPSATAENMW